MGIARGFFVLSFPPMATHLVTGTVEGIPFYTDDIEVTTAEEVPEGVVITVRDEIAFLARHGLEAVKAVQVKGAVYAFPEDISADPRLATLRRSL